MTISIRKLLCIFLLPTLALTACKRKEAPAADATASATSSVPAPVAPTPAAPVAAAPAVAQPFDVNTVPPSTATMPPFPFISLPEGVQGYHSKDVDFDRTYVLAGRELRAVEGHLSERWFPPSVVKMSTLATYRNYDKVIKSLGGVKVNTAQPGEPAFIAANGGDREAILKKLQLPNLNDTLSNEVPPFTQYLIRTPSANIWISVGFFDDENNVTLKVLEEQALQQTVGLVTADKIASTLKQDGHIALYLNFDTDSNAIRPDSLPVVEQIVKLLAGDKSLALKIEGHTDATGDAAHNRALSLSRAQAVVKALVDQKIPASRLSADGKGADQPIADNGTEAGREKNRRVELVRS
jgi:OOP family OmpA-OmpF porin